MLSCYSWFIFSFKNVLPSTYQITPKKLIIISQLISTFSKNCVSSRLSRYFHLSQLRCTQCFFLFLGEMALKSKVFKCHSNRPTISSSFSFLRCTKPPNNVLRNEMSFSSHIAPKCHQHHHTIFIWNENLPTSTNCHIFRSSQKMPHCTHKIKYVHWTNQVPNSLSMSSKFINIYKAKPLGIWKYISAVMYFNHFIPAQTNKEMWAYACLNTVSKGYWKFS